LYPALAYGGAARAAYHLAEALQQQGHEVAVLTTDVWDAASRYRQNSFRPPFEVIHLRNVSNWAAYHLQFYTPIHAAKESKRLLASADIVHLHTFRNILNDVIARAAVNKRIPFVLSGHGTIPRIERFKNLKRAYDLVLGNWQLRHASGFLALSRTEARRIARAIPENRPVAIIPNGVTEFDPPEPGLFRRKWSIRPEEKLVLFLGKITRRKGVQHLVRAYSGMSSEARLVIAGNDMGYGEEIRRLITHLGLQQRVLWTGLLPDSEKFQALQDADVTVYPSIHEAFGLVPLESLSCGTPVVVCGDHGCGEIIRKTRGGEIVCWGDSKGLAYAIRTQLREGKNRPDLAHAAGYIRDHFRWPLAARAVSRFYERILGSA
jgi:glycosyltransferase involved in cell wall biosynthesis